MKIHTSTLILAFLLLFNIGFTQQKKDTNTIALKIINDTELCSLITLNENGFPEARMMQTLPVKNDFVIWLGTNPKTRKVQQIKDHPKVSVYYTETGSAGYVNIQGEATIINDPYSKQTHWKEGWEKFYPDKKNDFVLIKITPVKLQIVSYSNGIVSTSENWQAPETDFN